MPRLRLLARLVTSLAVGLTAFAVAPAVQAAIPSPTLVTADAETVPVTHSGDAADDPALWVNPSNPGASLLIGNDKLGALEVYNLDGSFQQRITTATSFWGNVDVRQQVNVDGNTLDVVAAYNAGLRMYTVNTGTRTLQSVTDGSGVVNTNGGEGLCLYDSAISGDVFAFVITRPGQLRQFRLTDADSDGLLEATLVREFAVGSESEGCVADDDSGLLYVEEEDVGLWRYGAEPGAGSARMQVDEVQPNGHLAADAEGITLVDGGGGAGYLIASAQNVDNPTQSYFVVYDRQTNAYVGAFRIVNGSAADGCSRTDGVTAYAGNLGPSFPNGAFVCQDDNNTTPGGSGNQDFKLTRLEKVVDLGAVGGNSSPDASFTVTCPQLTCNFNANGSDDADGSIASYTWQFGDGTTGSGISPSHTYSGPGSRTVTLTVRDNENAIGLTTRVANPSAPPSGSVSFVAANSANGNKTNHTVQIPASAQAGDALLLYFTGNVSTSTLSSPAGWTLLRSGTADGIVGRLWSKVATSGDAGSTVSVTSSAIMKADFTVAAYRGSGGSPVDASAVAVDTVTRATHTTPTVNVANTGSWLVSYWADKSSATTGWATPAGQTLRSGSTSTGGGHITAMLADANGPVAVGTRGGITATANTNASRAAMFSVVLHGGSGAANQPPTASFTVSCVELDCSFDASGSDDPDGTIKSWAWTFGDGASDTGESTSHSYAAPGARTVTLIVTDNDNATDSTTRQATPTSTSVAISFVAANSANGNKTNHTVQIPASTQAGDALLLFFAGNVSTSTLTAPAGWTQVQSGTADGVVGRLWSRVATASDAGSTVGVGSSAYIKADLTAAVYRSTANPPVGTSAVRFDTATTNTHTTPTVTVSESGGWLVSYWADKSSTTTAWTAPAGQTVRSSSTSTGGGHVTAVLTDGNGPVATGTRGGLTATANGSASRAVSFTAFLKLAG